MDYDIYGAKNAIREATTRMAKVMIDRGKYPMMVRRFANTQVNLTTIKMKKLNGSILDWIDAHGQGYPSVQEGLRYMIRHYLCYVENPITRYDKQKRKIESYQKRIVTASPEIVALWLGEAVEDIRKKYKIKFDGYETTDQTHEPIAPYLELKVGKDGEHKITKPRKDINLADDGLTVTPLYLVNASLNAIREQMAETCTKFVFVKDNHHPRTLVSTMNHDYLKSVYSDDTSWLMDVKAKEYSQKDLMDCDTVFRGYVRFAEVGGSAYDSATRSVNFARITELEPNTEPDLSLVNVDLSTVLPAFTSTVADDPSIERLIKTQFNKYGVEKETSLVVWADKCEKDYSTEFKRDLARFMIEHSERFKGFTGDPVRKQSKSAGIGIEVDDIDLADYLDF